jgi:RNA polymerase sigma-B factor
MVTVCEGLPDTAVDRDRASGWPDDTATQELLARMAASGTGGRERQALRTEVIERNLPRVMALARRFARRGEVTDDLTQVAAVGLVKAVDRYDHGRNVAFGAYLVPTVIGELKRYFRDNGWGVRVPRALQERKFALDHATASLTARLGKVPSRPELAGYLDLTEDQVAEGLLAAQAYPSLSLNQPVRTADGEEGCERQDLLGAPDSDLERVTDRCALRQLLGGLTERQRRLLAMRFGEELSQSEMAARLGISQMQVSRLLAQLYAELREQLEAVERPAGPPPPGHLDVTVCTGAGRTIVMLVRGVVDGASVGALRDHLVSTAVRRRPACLVVDLAGVARLAPAALGAVLAAHRACGHAGTRLVLTNLAPGVLSLLRRAGLTRMVSCQPARRHATPPTRAAYSC